MKRDVLYYCDTHFLGVFAFSSPKDICWSDFRRIISKLCENEHQTIKEHYGKRSRFNIERMNIVLFLVSNIIINSTVLLYPVMPESCVKILKIFNLKINNINITNFEGLLKKNVIVSIPTPIFPRIEL